MKKVLVATLATIMITVSASAQMDRMVKDSSYKTEKGLKGGKGNGHHKKGQMIKELGLTKEQMSQMKTINQTAKSKMQELKLQDKITVAEMNTRKKAIGDERLAKLKTVLTPEQFAKMQTMKDNAKKQHKGKRGGEGADDDAQMIL